MDEASIDTAVLVVNGGYVYEYGVRVEMPLETELTFVDNSSVRGAK